MAASMISFRPNVVFMKNYCKIRVLCQNLSLQRRFHKRRFVSHHHMSNCRRITALKGIKSEVKRFHTTKADDKTVDFDAKTNKTDTNISVLAKKLNAKLQNGPSLQQFLLNSVETHQKVELDQISSAENAYNHPYVKLDDVSGKKRKVYFEVYGCQMNVNDTEIAWSILEKHDYERTANIRQADVILVVTCAIREGAEQKVWNKLEYLKSLKRRRETVNSKHPLKIGILGCMAERLKHKLLEKEKMVDLVAGPDSYRDLPKMLAITETGQSTVNVLLSLDETYADVMPIHLDGRCSAFVSIMRGCDNMCSYCIVPFTRGRERSRPISSILDEIRILSDRGVKEVVLLGQNVNSYRETIDCVVNNEPTRSSRGFVTLYKAKMGGLRFVDLLEQVSDIDSEMRIRFTSPHPKDFPDEVLNLIKERSNICKQLHLPAQSGNNRVLAAMRRGYTKESYLELVANVRSIIPDIALSSDFICGFCGETEQEFQDTIDLLSDVKYNYAYLFSYSMREKTHAFHKMIDDVPKDVKNDRLNRMIAVFRKEAEVVNRRQIGSRQVVLIEGFSKRSTAKLAGRNDYNTKVIVPYCDIPESLTSDVHRTIRPGDYVLVQINEANSQVLKGTPLFHVTLNSFTSDLTERFTQNFVN